MPGPSCQCPQNSCQCPQRMPRFDITSPALCWFILYLLDLPTKYTSERHFLAGDEWRLPIMTSRVCDRFLNLRGCHPIHVCAGPTAMYAGRITYMCDHFLNRRCCHPIHIYALVPMQCMPGTIIHCICIMLPGIHCTVMITHV